MINNFKFRLNNIIYINVGVNLHMSDFSKNHLGNIYSQYRNKVTEIIKNYLSLNSK